MFGMTEATVIKVAAVKALGFRQHLNDEGGIAELVMGGVYGSPRSS
jgi:hypothetical protein